MLGEVAATAAGLTASTIPITVASQGVVLTWLRHGLGDIVELLRAHAAGSPAMPVWRAGLAAALAHAGRREEALLEFERLAADDFGGLPRDNLWLAAMALLSETALTLGPVRRGAGAARASSRRSRGATSCCRPSASSGPSRCGSASWRASPDATPRRSSSSPRERARDARRRAHERGAGRRRGGGGAPA